LHDNIKNWDACGLTYIGNVDAQDLKDTYKSENLQ
jgi:hypothetical protein